MRRVDTVAATDHNGGVRLSNVVLLNTYSILDCHLRNLRQKVVDALLVQWHVDRVMNCALWNFLDGTSSFFWKPNDQVATGFVALRGLREAAAERREGARRR